MYSRTFGYNFFSTNSYSFLLLIIPISLPIVLGIVLALFLSYTWMIATIAYYLLLLAVGYWIRNHRESLVIDETGITLKKLSGNIEEFISWSDFGGMRRKMSKDRASGIGIIRTKNNPDEQTNGLSRTIFIQTTLGPVAGSKVDVIKAIESGIDCYVNHKRSSAYGFDEDADSLKLLKIGTCLLFVLFAIGCIYFAYQYEGINSVIHQELINHSLINGANFSGSVLSTILVYTLIFSGLAMVILFPSALMSRLFKHTAGIAGAALALLIMSYFLIIPDQKTLFKNCHDLSFQPADTVTTVVDRVYSGKSSKYTSFHIDYDGTNYKIETDYVEGAAKNMPMRVVVQKGSLNIPVITMIEIKHDDFYWKRHILGDAFNDMAYEYASSGDLQQALTTIEKAIATDSTIANYYDSKGEFLLRNGDKDGAARMWMKVITLDSHFGDNNNSWLQKRLIKLGILKTSRLKKLQEEVEASGLLDD